MTCAERSESIVYSIEVLYQHRLDFARVYLMARPYP